MEQRIHSGQDATACLVEELARTDGAILLVSGNDTYTACGISETLEHAADGRDLLRFGDFSPNPQLEELQRLHEFVAQHGIEQFGAILAVGGGTAMDLGKLIKAFGTGPTPESETITGGAFAPWEIPLIAVPTTAGSGSESTQFAVVYTDQIKYSIEHPALRPEVCLLIPKVLVSLPESVAAESGLDALCQGIESYWSVGSTPESRELASRAVQLAFEYLAEFVLIRTKRACFAMSEAANFAGQAINLTKTTAPHAVSYPITAHFGVPHGHAVAFMVAAMFPFNEAVGDDDVLDARGVGYARDGIGEICAMLGCEDAAGARLEILNLIRRIGLAGHLRDFDIGAYELSVIVTEGFNPGRVNNNPRRLTHEALSEILHAELER